MLLVLLTALFLVNPRESKALPLVGEIRGLDCGVAGGPNGMDKCCYDGSHSLSAFNGIRGVVAQFSSVPIISNINDMFVELDNVQNKYGKSSKCVLGREINSAAGCVCGYAITHKSPKKLDTLCRQYIKGTTIREQKELNNCLNCTQKGSGNEYFWSALGCIPLDTKKFINDYVFVYGLGLAGVIAFLCIIYNAIRIQMSEGNTERLKKATDNLRSCFMGLALILFAVFILKIIGVDILRIPGLQ